MDAYHIREAFTKTLPEAARGAEKAISGYFTCWMSMDPSWRIMLVTSWQTSFSHGSYPVTVKTTAKPPHIAANWKSTWDICPHSNHGSSSRRNNNHGGSKMVLCLISPSYRGDVLLPPSENILQRFVQVRVCLILDPVGDFLRFTYCQSNDLHTTLCNLS